MDKRRTFVCTFTATVELEVSVDMLKTAQTTDWRNQFYDLDSDEAVVEHIAYNVLRNDIVDVRNLDGFGDRKQSDMVVREEDWEDANVEEVK